MIPIGVLRERADEIKAGIKARGGEYPDVDTILEIDTECRELSTELNLLRAQRNQASHEAARARGQSGIAPTADATKRLAELRDRIGGLENELGSHEAKRDTLLFGLPQPPHSSVPIGRTAADNAVVKEVNATVEIVAKPRPHYEIGERMNLLDERRGVKVSGEGFYFLVGDGARLETALLQFMRDLHRSKGYIEVVPPVLINSASMRGTGQLPKFGDDSYHVVSDDLWLAPTAEVPVTNMFRDEILLVEDLPVRLMAYSACFRREAGAHGVETRGIARVHQFNKVELVNFTTPESSYAAHEAMLSDAEDVVQKLGLRYRVLNLCTGDLPDKAAKCYDIEVWAPGTQRWLEVSSVSNFESYQAARAGIRFRRTQESKTELVHTLNGSGTALPRLMIAILETYQTEDGSVVIPPVLRSFFGGAERLSPTRFVGERELGRGRHPARGSARTPAPPSSVPSGPKSDSV